MGSRKFQASSAIGTFLAADSALNGGKSGRAWSSPTIGECVTESCFTIGDSGGLWGIRLLGLAG
jgi:hypothetical protein